MDWCLRIGKEKVAPMRELVWRVAKLGMLFKLVVPPNQKFPSNEAQHFSLLKS
jgi:hypothetical protein